MPLLQATDAVIELIYCSSVRGRPKEDYARLVQGIVPEVMALRPRWVSGGPGAKDCSQLAEESSVAVFLRGDGVLALLC